LVTLVMCSGRYYGIDRIIHGLVTRRALQTE